ncbi:hypothetical protein NT05HA_1222 [Aggregatibacter aphrophilus NJ8700]|nr:hypothetical protein NT05HA_1222 [Aggregatibacter aphrophilus NJ8700]EHB90956.1 hypothetical protein HMPREF9335_00646 [Aggregatibacter aphrophilus F0387]
MGPFLSQSAVDFCDVFTQRANATQDYLDEDLCVADIYSSFKLM